MDERSIIELYFNRSESAIDETAKKYGGYLKCVARNILVSREDCEETVNDTYLAVWNAIPPEEPRDLLAYLSAITRNIAIAKWNMEHAEKRGGGEIRIALDEIQDCIPSNENSRNLEEQILLTDLMNRFLDSLPKEKRIIFMRRYWSFSPISEIARDLCISESKVKMTLHRLKKELKKLLESEGVEL